MKRKPVYPTHPRVALLVESSFGYGRELLMGIAKYVRVHAHWSCEFEEGDPNARLPKWFDRMEWDGIIARVKSKKMADAITRKGVPVVDLSGCVPGCKFPVICSDEGAVARIAAEHLVERGFKNFAFCGFEGTMWSDLRQVGFETAVKDLGFTCHSYAGKDPSQKTSTVDYEQHGEGHVEALKKWIASLPKPIGLMACNDSRGRQIINCCKESKIAVPDDVAIIGVDKDDIFSELSGIPLSSVILNAQQIGYESAVLLNKMMMGLGDPPQTTTVKPVGVAMRHSTDVLAIDDPHISKALQYIREHACEGMDVQTLLEEIPLSRSVLERRFSQLLGTSPKTEILRTRLNRVRQLLSESDLSLAEIADRAGFEYPEYMSRLFKKKMGITPGEFRRQSAPDGLTKR
ncbi:MAG: DNA-binding transcriptional regulator [Luteolibacter sp.]